MNIQFIKLANWGNYPTILADEIPITNPDHLKQQLAELPFAMPKGNHRSYGDAGLATHLLSCLAMNKILSFDENTGDIWCEAGVTLEQILMEFVPRGWFLPVTPGTKFITIGGAIAADVHGKNHHGAGSFSKHLRSIEILLPDGTGRTCSPIEKADLFWATCGGMGLTGFILNARFRLQRIETAYIRQEAIRASNLDHIMELFEESTDWTYSVAWIDCHSRGDQTGRSILYRGEHAARADLKNHPAYATPLKLPAKRQLTVPFHFPGFALNSLSVKAFNFLYYHKQPNGKLESIVDYNTFFYPLDAIHHWNRIYGRRGFTQYQLVLPKSTSREGLSHILNEISRRRMGSFLAVLKLFGPQDDLISFPMEGYTLALDFPMKKGLFTLLDRLDELVLKYGGRLYLAKDTRATPLIYQKGYPRYAEFVDRVRQFNPRAKLQSLQSQRLGITPMKHALILGAGSDIARALALRLVQKGFKLILAARNPEPFADEFKKKYGIDTIPAKFDALDFENHAHFYAGLPVKPDLVVCAFGYLGNQVKAQTDFAEARRIIDTNYTGAVSILNRVAADMIERKGGTIVGISSVAGDRGRQSNYLYGSAKAGFTAYLSGLRNQLHPHGIQVLTVKPGFVRTKMTTGLPLNPRLTATPEQVAEDIDISIEKKSNILYTKRLWRWIIFVVVHIPEFVFKKMKL